MYCLENGDPIRTADVNSGTRILTNGVFRKLGVREEFDIPPKISGKAFSARVDTHMCVSVFVAVSEYRGDRFNYFLSKARKHGRCV